MYPVIVRRLADLRAEDRIVARDGQRYGKPLRVVGTLGPIEPGSPVQGVRVASPNPDSPIEWVLYPSQMDGQQLEVDRRNAFAPKAPNSTNKGNNPISRRK